MNTTRLSQVRRLFVRPGVPRHTARYNMRQWVRAVRIVRTTKKGWQLDCHLNKEQA